MAMTWGGRCLERSGRPRPLACVEANTWHRLPSTAWLPLQDHPFLGSGEIPGGELYRRGARACQVGRRLGSGPGPSSRAVGCGCRWNFPISASAPSRPGLPAASPVSPDPRPTLAWPRSVLFNPDGCCLYSGCQDSLRVYGWEPERCFDVVLVNWGKVADLAICNDQLVREPPPTVHPSAGPPACLPLRPPTPTRPWGGPAPPTASPSTTAKGPAPALPLPADRRGLLPEQRLLLCGGPDAGHQDRHGSPGPHAGQPAPGAAAAPPQRPASAHLRAAQRHRQRASEVGCSGPRRALGGAGGGSAAPASPGPPPPFCLACSPG